MQVLLSNMPKKCSKLDSIRVMNNLVLTFYVQEFFPTLTKQHLQLCGEYYLRVYGLNFYLTHPVSQIRGRKGGQHMSKGYKSSRILIRKTFESLLLINMANSVLRLIFSLILFVGIGICKYTSKQKKPSLAYSICNMHVMNEFLTAQSSRKTKYFG